MSIITNLNTPKDFTTSNKKGSMKNIINIIEITLGTIVSCMIISLMFMGIASPHNVTGYFIETNNGYTCVMNSVDWAADSQVYCGDIAVVSSLYLNLTKLNESVKPTNPKVE